MYVVEAFSVTACLGEGPKLGCRSQGTRSGLGVGDGSVGVFHGALRRLGCDVGTVTGEGGGDGDRQATAGVRGVRSRGALRRAGMAGVGRSLSVTDRVACTCENCSTTGAWSVLPRHERPKGRCQLGVAAPALGHRKVDGYDFLAGAVALR